MPVGGGGPWPPSRPRQPSPDTPRPSRLSPNGFKADRERNPQGLPTGRANGSPAHTTGQMDVPGGYSPASGGCSMAVGGRAPDGVGGST